MRDNQPVVGKKHLPRTVEAILLYSQSRDFPPTAENLLQFSLPKVTARTAATPD